MDSDMTFSSESETKSWKELYEVAVKEHKEAVKSMEVELLAEKRYKHDLREDLRKLRSEMAELRENRRREEQSKSSALTKELEIERTHRKTAEEKLANSNSKDQAFLESNGNSDSIILRLQRDVEIMRAREVERESLLEETTEALYEWKEECEILQRQVNDLEKHASLPPKSQIPTVDHQTFEDLQAKVSEQKITLLDLQENLRERSNQITQLELKLQQEDAKSKVANSSFLQEKVEILEELEKAQKRMSLMEDENLKIRNLAEKENGDLVKKILMLEEQVNEFKAMVREAKDQYSGVEKKLLERKVVEDSLRSGSWSRTVLGTFSRL